MRCKTVRGDACSYWRPMGAAMLAALLAIGATLSMAAPVPQENRSRRFAPGVCGPADPSYIRMAEETGGIPMFLLPTEISKTTRLMLVRSGQNSVTLLWATGALQGVPYEFSVPLDSVLKEVAFSLSVDTHATTMDVLAPSGTPIGPVDAGAEVSDLNCGRLVILKNPSPGAYRIRVKGSGRFWIAVEGQSDIFLHGLRFVERGGRPGHEGLFPIAGQPLIGKPATLEASLSGKVQSSTFNIVSATNNTIRRVNMRTVDEETDDREFVGTFDLPDSPFRISVTGNDQNGYPYQRVFHTLFHAATVAVVAEGSAEVLPGKTATLTYSVRNAGGPASFRIVAYAGRGYETRAEPSEVTLPTGASAKVQVSVTVPADTPPGSGFDLTVTATSVADSSVYNGAYRHLSIALPRPQ